MSHTDTAKQEPYRRELSFAPGEAERALIALGFDAEKLRNNDYFVKAVEAVGDVDALEDMILQYRALVALPRVKLMGEAMCRMTFKAWTAYRDQAVSMDVQDIARDVLRSECRRRHGFLIAEMVGMA